jgi:hypothetical protein
MSPAVNHISLKDFHKEINISTFGNLPKYNELQKCCAVAISLGCLLMVDKFRNGISANDL